jgi:hypothetical protein
MAQEKIPRLTTLTFASGIRRMSWSMISGISSHWSGL